MGTPVGKVSDFLLELYRQAQVLEPQSFQWTMLDHLHELLPYDYAAWGGGEAEDRQVTEVVVANQSQRLLTRWPEVGHLDGFCDITLRHLNRTFTFDDVPDYRRGVAYNEHWRTFDVRHMMSTIMAEPADGYVSFLGLCNGDAARPFTESQRALKQMLMPHISEALRLNRRMALGNEPDPDEGRAIVNRAGWILASHGAFAALAREEWGAGFGPRLPVDFGYDGQSTGDWCGRHIQVRYRRIGDYLLLTARPRSKLDRLPPRSREAAELYAEGLTHKEVARRLGISPETVRKHLALAYERLGVSSKTALAELARPRLTL
ncbi:MAG: helix-turn-helix transcriptional regulator [Ectothiorhodospiraceae bacterium]|jgi:DNA-binding CsgD family transcriptional regulator